MDSTPATGQFIVPTFAENDSVFPFYELAANLRMQFVKQQTYDVNGNHVGASCDLDDLMAKRTSHDMFLGWTTAIVGVHLMVERIYFLAGAQITFRCKGTGHVVRIRLEGFPSAILDQAGFVNVVNMILAEEHAYYLEEKAKRARHAAQHLRGQYTGDRIGVRKVSFESVSVTLKGN